MLAQTQRGKATFYSKRATGARTASGDRLHHDSLTCAHRTYPFGTLLKVTNLSNNKSVVVKVTDRGPFARGRIIDLSWRAAKELDILAKGVGTVRVERYNGSEIPYRPAEGVNLPEIDFEITEAGYSFTGEWAERMKQSDMPTTKTKRKHTAKLPRSTLPASRTTRSRKTATPRTRRKRATRGPISSRPSRRRAKRCSDPFPLVRVAAEAIVQAPEVVSVVPKIALLPLICDKNSSLLPMICNKFV